MKGFKTYLAIDKILDKDEWNKRIEFTYFGNIFKIYLLKIQMLLSR